MTSLPSTTLNNTSSSATVVVITSLVHICSHNRASAKIISWKTVTEDGYGLFNGTNLGFGKEKWKKKITSEPGGGGVFCEGLVLRKVYLLANSALPVRLQLGETHAAKP